MIFHRTTCNRQSDRLTRISSSHGLRNGIVISGTAVTGSDFRTSGDCPRPGIASFARHSGIAGEGEKETAFPGSTQGSYRQRETGAAKREKNGMNIQLKFTPDEYLDLGGLAAQFQCISVEDLFQSLGSYMLEAIRDRQQMAGTLPQIPDSAFRGMVN